MNPYHDENGRFTEAGNAAPSTGPRTSPAHSERHRAAVARGEDPRDAAQAGPIRKPPKGKVPPLTPEEIAAMRTSPTDVITDDDADRRDLGLHPFPRSEGPHLITAPGAQTFPGIPLGGANVDQLHGRMVYQHHTGLVRKADREGTNHGGSPTVPGTPDATRPGMSPGFGRAPTRAARPARTPSARPTATRRRRPGGPTRMGGRS